jgi:A/G-specific adenine glycosylase
MHQIPEKLLFWYDTNARSLPWRSDPTPYKVWVSEIMLQQTQVDTVIPYFRRFVERFPDLHSLARAEESEVLQVWEGLGYYSRARNLHKAARIIVNDHFAQIPADVAALRSLPGIGAYTAGAIASIAFGAPEPALDANIRRVYLRLLDLHEPPGSETDTSLWEFARKVLPGTRVGDYNQALMDLGSAVCTPTNPACQLCPVQAECLAFQRRTQSELPVRKPKAKVPHKLVVAAVITRGSKVLLAHRPTDGMLGNLWEYPGGSVPEDTSDLPKALQGLFYSRFGLIINVDSSIGTFKHAYTHFRITLHAFYCELTDSNRVPLPRGFAWVEIAELSVYPMGKVARQISGKIKGCRSDEVPTQ